MLVNDRSFSLLVFGARVSWSVWPLSLFLSLSLFYFSLQEGFYRTPPSRSLAPSSQEAQTRRLVHHDVPPIAPPVLDEFICLLDDRFSVICFDVFQDCLRAGGWGGKVEMSLVSLSESHGQSRGEQSRAEGSRAEQSRGGQSRGEQSRGEQRGAEQSQAT